MQHIITIYHNLFQLICPEGLTKDRSEPEIPLSSSRMQPWTNKAPYKWNTIYKRMKGNIEVAPESCLIYILYKEIIMAIFKHSTIY